MEDKNKTCSLEQELAEKAGKLDAERIMREQDMVKLTLDRIVGSVTEGREQNKITDNKSGILTTNV
jgi:hypothetical protein